MTTTPNIGDTVDNTAGAWQIAALWAGLGTAIAAALAWDLRARLLPALAPYGVSAPDTSTADRPRSTAGAAVHTATYGAGHVHITALGWLTLVIVAAGVMATLWCVVGAAVWVRWRAARGRKAVPVLPAPAVAVSAAAGVFVLIQVLYGRHTSSTVHTVVFMAGVIMAVAAWFAVTAYAITGAEHWQKVQAFAASADRVLGHEHAGVGRVHARDGWDTQLHDRVWWHWPHTLIAATGPNWQHKDAELDALNRAAHAFGWPPYKWVHDPLRRYITGTVCPEHWRPPMTTV